jgi:hypothetical protein
MAARYQTTIITPDGPRKVGATDGTDAPQDPRGLPRLPQRHPWTATNRDTHAGKSLESWTAP